MSDSPRFGREVAALILGLVILASGCGAVAADGDGQGGGVATLADAERPADGAAASTSEPESELDAPDNPEDAFALFDECMDDAGFGMGGTTVFGGDSEGGAIEVAPSPGSGDGTDPQGATGSIEDFDIESFEAASKDCEGHLANAGIGFDLSPEQEALMADAQLAFADCMAEHGVELPEFDPAGAGVVTIEIEGESLADPQTPGSGFDDAGFDFEGFENAAAECDHVFSEIEAQLEAPGE